MSRRWWMAAGFIVGSALFALGAVPAYSAAAGLDATALTFFLGSLFFTAAAFLQYRAAADAVAVRRGGGRKIWVWAWRDMDWLTCVVQLAGTLWFNWSTGNALQHNITAVAADERVWRPDLLGSIAFLVASGISWAEAHHDAIRDRHRTRLWWIATLNVLGSVAFGVSAVTAYVVPASGNVWDAELSNLGTFAGALCFLAGAVLLLPRSTTRTPTRSE